jgi:hypothetical protein
MAFDAAARIEAAATSTRLSGIPYLGHSQTNATGPWGGSGQTQNSCRDWRPPPCPPRYRPRASRPRCRRTSCRGCSPCARRRTRRVAKQLGRRALMLAAVPFADPLIERPAPADRAREGIESYLEPDRIGHDPGEGDRCLLASASTPEPAAPHQSTRRGRRSNPASPPRTPPGAAGGFRSSKNPTRQA